jgi:predicted transposase/invertase (TIGR01784 family)
MASKVLMTISKDEEERFRLLSEEKYILDTQSKVVHAKRQGEAKGRTEEKLKIARKMKEMGDSVERIQTITGLTTEAIQKL